ncbi:hypothetical protein RCL_jg23137.t1 [Rhizophagus clarus]|uniref:Uncharacterized protein n=1 Tax=Rhizophagus clarus TaxID=94130 RepID=A0A8H3L6D2_9GLOM|nr:hypothetical protein RCL_jg23137.t1 [Rhizophagus clarus]
MQWRSIFSKAKTGSFSCLSCLSKCAIVIKLPTTTKVEQQRKQDDQKKEPEKEIIEKYVDRIIKEKDEQIAKLHWRYRHQNDHRKRNDRSEKVTIRLTKETSKLFESKTFNVITILNDMKYYLRWYPGKWKPNK